MKSVEIHVIMRSIQKGYLVHGIYDGNGIKLLKGGQACKTVGPSLRQKVKNLRHIYLDDNAIIKEDIYFDSPSLASTFVCGRSSDGWVEWRDSEGNHLAVHRYANEEPKAIPLYNNHTKIQDINTINIRKEKIQTFLHDIIQHNNDISVSNNKSNTKVFFRNSLIATIYYISDGLKIVMDNTPSVHSLYNHLERESLAYQLDLEKQSITTNDFIFFVRIGYEETALTALLIDAGEGVLLRTKTNTLSNVQSRPFSPIIQKPSRHNPEAIEDPLKADESLLQSKSGPFVEAKTYGVGQRIHTDNPESSMGRTVNHEDSISSVLSLHEKRIEKKINQLLKTISEMKLETNNTPPDIISFIDNNAENDKRFHIETTNCRTHLIMIKNMFTITSLIFTLKFYVTGLDEDEEELHMYFINAAGDPLCSESIITTKPQTEYSCRFDLKSSASEEKIVLLIVKGKECKLDEARQMIQFPVNIPFSADFGGL